MTNGRAVVRRTARPASSAPCRRGKIAVHPSPLAVETDLAAI
jgi:hypothetical protein